jgi:hypothetical protein
MSRITYDGNESVWWVTSIADVTAPTDDEINAGLDISAQIDHPVKRGAGTARVKNEDVTALYDLELPGTAAMKPSLEVIRDADPLLDDTYAALSTPNTSGYLVIREMVPHTPTVEVGDVVDVLPCMTCIPQKHDSARNARVMATIELALSDDPALDVAVVNGS